MQINKDDLVSIIVPCYNYGCYLSETLESVLQQEHRHWECIIVNDGSTDNTEEVATLYQKKDHRFRYVYQKHKGLSNARNTGISHSKGNYLQFLDSDDKLHPSKIKIQAIFLQEHPQVDIVYGDSFFFFSTSPEKLFSARGSKRINSLKQLRVSGNGREMLSKLLVNNIMEVSCGLIKRDVIEQTGLFDEAFKSYEDWEFWIRCAIKDCSFFYLPASGTETYIRCGHSSMLANKEKLTTYGIRLRHLIKPYLSKRERCYNYYRLSKLYFRTFLKIY